MWNWLEKKSMKNAGYENTELHYWGITVENPQFLAFEIDKCDLMISTNHPHTYTLDLI